MIEMERMEKETVDRVMMNRDQQSEVETTATNRD
jgi:hypothetical protein